MVLNFLEQLFGKKKEPKIALCDDVLLEILRCLPCEDVQTCRLVNRQFYNIIHTNRKSLLALNCEQLHIISYVHDVYIELDSITNRLLVKIERNKVTIFLFRDQKRFINDQKDQLLYNFFKRQRRRNVYDSANHLLRALCIADILDNCKERIITRKSQSLLSKFLPKRLQKECTNGLELSYPTNDHSQALNELLLYLLPKIHIKELRLDEGPISENCWDSIMLAVSASKRFRLKGFPIYLRDCSKRHLELASAMNSMRIRVCNWRWIYPDLRLLNTSAEIDWHDKSFDHYNRFSTILAVGPLIQEWHRKSRSIKNLRFILYIYSSSWMCSPMKWRNFMMQFSAFHINLKTDVEFNIILSRPSDETQLQFHYVNSDAVYPRISQIHIKECQNH